MKKILSAFVAVVTVFSLCIVPVTASEDAQTTDLLVMGDSIAAGTGLVAPEECCYGALVAKANGYNYNNIARSGNTAAHLKYEVSNFYLRIMNSEIIAISVGGNDLLWGNLIEKINQALFNDNYEMIDELIEYFYYDIKSAILSIKEINPDATVLVQTLYNPRFDMLAGVYQYAADGINQKLSDIAEELPGAFHIVDVASALGRNPFYFSVDTLHPSKLGHYKIAKVYLKVLNELGLGEELTPPAQPSFFEIPNYFDRLMEVINEYVGVISSFLS